MYGGIIKFASVQPGEIVSSFNPSIDHGVFYMVDSVDAVLPGRGTTKFIRLVPVSIQPNSSTTVVRRGFEKGASGSPIVNHKGEPIGIFGLGMLDCIMGENNCVKSTVKNYCGIPNSMSEPSFFLFFF